MFENKTTPALFFGQLQSSVIAAKAVHWQTNSYSEHMTMATYYEEMSELLDTLVETYFGTIGKKFEVITPKTGFVNSQALMKHICDFVESNRNLFKEYSFIENIIDEILALIEQTKYRLTLS